MKAINIFSVIAVVLFAACKPNDADLAGIKPEIFPDYSDVMVPYNIAPLHFTFCGDCDSQYAIFKAGETSVGVSSKKGQIAISAGKWKKLTGSAKGSSIEVSLFAKEGGRWIQYNPFSIYVSEEKIDQYVAYRLIEPGYEIWNEMGIYQRNLENFRESAILTNNQTDYGCMNCHSFCQRNPDQMLFHLRVGYGGTYVLRNGEMEKLNTKTPETVSALVYPQWHPSGKYVAFSVNSTKQMFHTTDPNRVEVFDYTSDVVVYDVERKEIISCPELKAYGQFETFPTFSPDGNTLYYCVADSLTIPENYDKVKYSLCKIGFNPDNRSFSSQVDTLVKVSETDRSVSFPRVSPDGRHLMLTLSDYGNFSIWHNDSDLYMLDLENGEYKALDEANSDYVDSYHCWSGNGRWVIFSSRRLDHLYTRLFITHIDENGNASKAFLLPQKDVNFYKSLMKSYNIPEFIEGKVDLDIRKFHLFAKEDKGKDLSFVE